MEPKEEKKHSPKPAPHEVPPHILHELLELREKVGKLEGMMEILLKSKTTIS